jgi:hypothetical protein
MFGCFVEQIKTTSLQSFVVHILQPLSDSVLRKRVYSYTYEYASSNILRNGQNKQYDYLLPCPSEACCELYTSYGVQRRYRSLHMTNNIHQQMHKFHVETLYYVIIYTKLPDTFRCRRIIFKGTFVTDSVKIGHFMLSAAVCILITTVEPGKQVRFRANDGHFRTSSERVSVWWSLEIEFITSNFYEFKSRSIWSPYAAKVCALGNSARNIWRCFRRYACVLLVPNI